MTGFPIPTLETAEAVEQTDLLPIAQVNGGGNYSKARRATVTSLGDGIAVTQDGAGSVARSIRSKLLDLANVKDYGATVIASDNSAAFAAMAAEYGYIVVPSGGFALASITIDVPIIFAEGGYISANAGQTVTIRRGIEAGLQHILRGDGAYSLTHQGTSSGRTGEEVRRVKAAWFGAFPNHPTIGPTDQAPLIQKMFDSLGNIREGVCEFEIGNYIMGSATLVPRGVKVLGQGERRTVFEVNADGYVPFTTNEQGVWFEGFQFEGTPRNSALIRIDHAQCVIKDVGLTGCMQQEGIIVGPGGSGWRIRGIWLAALPAGNAGSRLISLQANNGELEGVFGYSTSATGPESIVHVGGAAVGNVRISGVRSFAPSRLVHVDATAGNLNRIDIDGCSCGPFAGPTRDAGILIETGSTFGIDGLTISGVEINGAPTNGIVINHAGSGVLTNVLIDTTIVQGSSGAGLVLNDSGSGTVGNIHVGDGFLTSRPTRVSYAGTAFPTIRNKPAENWTFSLADDTAQVIRLNRSIFSGFLLVSVANVERGIYTIRAATTPTITAFGTPSANLNATTGALTGTTGVDTKFTVSVDAVGLIYVENRLGSTQTVSVTLLSGF